MLSLDEALQQILQSARPIHGVERLPLASAAGRFLVEDALAISDLPPFDNSAMDGWAVRSADVQGAAADRPITLQCIAEIPAGSAFNGEINHGQCVRIFTGAPLPRGADAVVMQEDSAATLPGVRILDTVKPWENVRFRGEDAKRGVTLAQTGDRLTPQILSLCSACGVAEVKVRPQLRVAILATGNELKLPGVALSPGEIYESNRILIATLAQHIGVQPIVAEIVADNLEATVVAIRKAAEADAIITCGGVSVGEHDFIKAAISELGGDIDFWRVAIKPGKPFAHATVCGKPLFGLPGNPVSALVTFWLMVRPALLKMAGASQLAPALSFGQLAEDIVNPSDRRHFVRVIIDGEGKVRASGPQASHRLASLAAANALLDVPPGANWPVGKTVKTLLLS